MPKAIKPMGHLITDPTANDINGASRVRIIAGAKDMTCTVHDAGGNLVGEFYFNERGDEIIISKSSHEQITCSPCVAGQIGT